MYTLEAQELTDLYTSISSSPLTYDKYDIGNLNATYPTTSAKIRFLHSEGWDRSRISKHLQIRYQHVRNVLLQPIKKA